MRGRALSAAIVSPVALSLLGVLLVAKSLVLFRAGVSISAASLAAACWQDFACAGLVAVIDVCTGRSRWWWALYVPAVVLIAASVPVTRVLGSPLTWPMLHAAGGPLVDSIAYYARPNYLSAIMLVIVAGSVLPRFAGRLHRIPLSVAGAAVALTLGGAIAAPHVDLRGLDRNALTALVSVPRVSASAATPIGAAWRDSVFETSSSGLDGLRGSARGMNVVLVILESTAAQYLHTYGAPEDPMPTLGRLASSAVVFDAAYAVYPESVKGLYATLCAQSPRYATSMETFLATPASERPPCHPPALALKRAGYSTALFHSGRFGYLGMDALLAEQGFDHLEDAGAISGRVQSSFGVDEASTVAHTLAWIDTVRARSPFFAVYMPAAGHHPYASNVPPTFAGDDELSHYRNALGEADQALAALIDGLRSRGALDRTAFIVLGDHGEGFGQHPGNGGHTLFIHDENVRVPLVISVPGANAGATRVSSPASVLDTAPTLLDLVGLSVHDDTEGQSLLRTKNATPRIAPFFADYSLGWVGLRDGCWKYQFNMNAAQSHLFDVCRDPGETVNRAADQPERVITYRKTLTNWK